jgi:cytochrome c oxidase assembly factor CtaG
LPPLADQQLAAAIMWVTGDLIFLGAIMTILVGWSRAEGRDTARADRQAAIDLVDIRDREARLAERLSRERDGT